MEFILQCGYMSGDTYAAAAYLLMSADRRILLLKDTKEPDDRSGMIEKIYRETGVIGQVVVVDISREEARAREVYRALDAAISSKRWPAADRGTSAERQLAGLLRQLPRRADLRKIVTVTGRVAEDFHARPAAALATVARAWGPARLSTDLKFALWGFMGEKFAGIGYEPRPNIVVLWSRQSGKRGGAHLEMDTSYKGIRQVARHFAGKGNATVLLAGDEKPVRLRDGMSGKLRLLASEDRHIIDVSGMWEQPVWREHFGQATFLAQFAFFHTLAAEFHVVHLGCRSGMLESMALLGMPTYYLEPTECGSGDRMLAFERHGIPYSRIQLSTHGLPGLTARAAQRQIEELTRRDRVPVVTPERIGRSIDGRVDSLQRNVGFLGDFGERNRRGWYQGTAASGQVARQVAKLELADNRRLFQRDDAPGDNPHSADAVDDWVNSARGFLPADLDRIAKSLESGFRK